MGVYKYTGNRGPVYLIDFYVNGKRCREKVGPKKEKAGGYLGEAVPGDPGRQIPGDPVRQVLFDALADLYGKQAKGRKSFHNEK